MISFNSLIIEVTRRCNMECYHCLRGKRQAIDMNPEHMRKLFSQTDFIHTVTFSGGEPTLPSGLKAIRYYILNAPDTGSFYIATNGKVRRKELPDIINNLYNFCSDNDISCIDVSHDNYHETDGYQRNNFKYWLEEEMFYRYGIELQMNKKEVYKVISQGRAEEWGDKENDKEEIIWNHGYDNDDDNIEIREGNVYLNCKGEIIAGCDWSYENQSKHIICTIDDDIQKAIMEYGTFDEDY